MPEPTVPHPWRNVVPLLGPAVLLLFVAILTSGTPTPAAVEELPDFADDGWRLTIDGWEHISRWDCPPVEVGKRALAGFTAAEVGENSVLDLHPAAWAMFQIFLALASLTLLPGSEPKPDVARA